jgi:hypothetical protein
MVAQMKTVAVWDPSVVVAADAESRPSSPPVVAAVVAPQGVHRGHPVGLPFGDGDAMCAAAAWAAMA